MFGFLAEFNTLELVFFASAVLGCFLFLVRLIVQFAGGADADIDVDAGGDVGVDASPDIGSSDVSFKLLSLEGITAFLAMFGLVGLAIAKTTDLGPLVAILGGGVAGFLAMWIIGNIFKTMVGLQSTGTLDLKNAVGQEGTVYLTVDPKDGGKVEVSVQDRLQVFDAVTSGAEALQTGTRIKVIEVRGNTLFVEKAS